MSACISSRGEYSEHVLSADGECEWCGAFDADTVRRAAFEAGAAWQAEQGVKPDRETVARLIEPDAWNLSNLDWHDGYGRTTSVTHSLDERSAVRHSALVKADAILAAWPGRTEQEVREQVAQEIETAYLGPDSGRNPIAGADPSDANERHAYDEGLEQAARIARGLA